MSRFKTLVRASLAGLALLLIVLLVTAVVARRLIHQGHLREQIAAAVSQRIGTNVQYDALRFRLLPFPSVVLRGVHLSIPGRIDASIASVSVSPRWLPLMRGKFQLGTVRINSPEITAHGIPASSAGTSSPGGLAAAVQSALDDMALAVLSQPPGAAVVVHTGTLTLPLREPDGGMLQLRRIEAHIRSLPDRLSVEAQCTSNVWERLALQAWVDPRTTDVSGKVEMTRLRPQFIAGDLVAPELRLGDSETNVTLNVSARSRLQTLHADVDGSIPLLTVARGDDQFVVRGPRLNASLDIQGDAVHITVAHLDLDAPRLGLSGTLSVAPGHAVLEVYGTDVDVDAARRTALLAAGQVRIVRSIFDVLRGGTVPQIDVISRAESLSGLGEDQALRIQGRLVAGRLHIPKVDLDLEAVTGDATVAEGVLVGEHACAQLGQSAATDGSVRVGLSASKSELQLEVRVHADATDLAAQLKRLVADKAFQDGLGRVSEVSGSASGTLALAGTTRDVALRADASAFNISGRVGGLRTPLRVEGGQFVYDRGEIEARDVTAVTGKSKLSAIALRALPGRTRSFEVTAGTSRMALDDVYSWLQDSGRLPESPWNPTALSGTLSLEFLRLGGSPDTDRWQVELIGSARKVAIESARLQQRIAIQYPVSLSGLRLRYDTRAGASFSAKVLAPGNLTGSVDMSWNTQRLDIKDVSVRDAQSDASLALMITPQGRSMRFKGVLTKATLDRLIENDVLGGSVRGNVSVRLGLDQAARTSVTGSLEAQNVTVPLSGGQHLTIETLAAEGAGNSVRGKAAVATSDGMRLQVQGRIEQPPQGLNVDLDVAAARLDWNAIAPWFAGGDNKVSAFTADPRMQSLRGNLRVAAESFSYGGFTWEPVRAVVRFAPGEATVKVDHAVMCGVTTPGTITVGSQGLTFAFKPVARDQPLQGLLPCLGVKGQLPTGQYSLSADVTARGSAAEISRSLHGKVQFDAAGGRLYGMGITARALSVISMATGAVWAISDIATEGLPYDELKVTGNVDAGNLVISEATLKGPTVNWAAEGTVDIPARSLDLTLLIAPLKTVDTVISRIPVLGGVLGGSLVSIPVHVGGDVTDPQVTPLPPSAVGKGLLNVMKRTLKLPLTVIQPLLPSEAKPEQ